MELLLLSILPSSGIVGMAVNVLFSHIVLSMTTSALSPPVHEDMCAQSRDFHISSSCVFGRHHILRVCLVVTNFFMCIWPSPRSSCVFCCYHLIHVCLVVTSFFMCVLSTPPSSCVFDRRRLLHVRLLVITFFCLVSLHLVLFSQ